MIDSPLAKLLCSLGVVVLERRATAKLALLNRPPTWFSYMFPLAGDQLDESSVRARSPFLYRLPERG